MPIRHPFVSGKAASADTTLVDGPRWNETHHAPPFAITLVATPTVIGNMPAAITEFDGLSRRSWLDLTQVTEFRTIVAVTIAGSTGSVVRIQYIPDGGVATELGALADVNVSIATTGTKRSAWNALPTGARADVVLRTITEGGDGVADPQVTLVVFQYR